MNNRVPFFCQLAVLVSLSAPAAVEVVVDQVNPARPDWSFTRIPRPSRSDAAATARIALTAGRREGRGAAEAVLLNGRLPNDSLDLNEGFLLSSEDAAGGTLEVDLGSIQPVAAVCTYSWHEWDVDGGSRAPQVYALSASADGASWTRLAAVDTRPDKSGRGWNGQHGALIRDPSALLGSFRHLRFELQATRSPRQGSPGLTNTLFTEIDVHTPETLAKAGDAVVPPKIKVTDVWIAFKTHFDIGYTAPVGEVLKRYRVAMMESALRNIEADRALPPNRRFSWILPGWPTRHILGPLQEPARREKIEQAIREGALSVQALPFSLHTETADLEDLVRGLGYSSAITRRFGRPLPLSAKATDVPSHSWVMPTLLHHAGVRFLHIGSNGSSGHLRVPHLFWWEGPDGSRVLCDYSNQYGSGIIPPRDWPSRHYLAMIMTGDNHGPPSQAEVANLRAQVERALPGVNVHFGTLDDYAAALLEEGLDFPVVRADMPDTWIHGWMSMPVESKAARSIRPFQPALEVLDTQLRAWGAGGEPVTAALAEAYELSNLYSEHTFGPWGPKNGPWETGIRKRFLYGAEWKEAMANEVYRPYEEGFLPKREYALKEERIVQREWTARLERLARSVAVEGRRCVVYNGLPWTRDGLVEAEGRLLRVEGVPASGYKVVTLSPATSRTAGGAAGGDALETPFYQVKFDLRRGGVSSLIEKKTGRQMVDAASPYALGQFLHERFDGPRMREYRARYARDGYAFDKRDLPPDHSAAAMTPPAWKLEVTPGTAADTAVLTATDTLGLAKGIRLVFTFHRHAPLVDMEWRVEEKTPDPIPEGGWLCFPLAIEQPQYRLGRLGGPIDPATEVQQGANRDIYCLSTGMTVTGADGRSVGLCPLDSPNVSLGEPGLWRYSMEYTPPKPTVFVNLYNNMWVTNFPEWQGGTWSSRVRFWPSADLVVPAWEARLPLAAVVVDGPAGSLPVEKAGLSVSRPGVLVTAFGANPDGEGTLLRVWDQSGMDGEVGVSLPGRFESATPVNLRGEKSGEPLKITGGRLSFRLGRYAPASFVLFSMAAESPASTAP